MEIQEIIRTNSSSVPECTSPVDAADVMVVDGDVLPVADVLEADGALNETTVPPYWSEEVPKPVQLEQLEQLEQPIDPLKPAQNEWERAYDRLEARNFTADQIRAQIGEYPTSIEDVSLPVIVPLGQQALANTGAAMPHTSTMRDWQLQRDIARVEADVLLTSAQKQQGISQLRALDRAARLNAGKRA